MKKQLSLVLFILTTVLVGYSASLEAKITDLKTQIPLNPKVKSGKLANGLTYYVMQNKKPENRVEIQMVVRAGSVQEEDHEQGLAHFTEHMFFNGTKNFPKDSLVKFLESTGVRFGADLNASVGFDRSFYRITIPLDKPNMFEKGMQVLEDWAMWVTFDSLEIEKERGVIIEEKRLRHSAQWRLLDIHLPVLLQGSKYAVRLPIGQEDVIRNAPRQTFVDFYNAWYRPDITAIYVIGDIDENVAINLIKKHFEHFAYRGSGTPKPIGKYPVADNKEPLISIGYDAELRDGSITLYIKHPERDELTYESFRESLKESMFAMMLNMRLQELTKEAQPPFLRASGRIGNFVAGKSRAFTFSITPKNGEFANGLERGLAELFRVDQHGFTVSEFERAKESIIASYERRYNERDKTESQVFARELVSHFQELRSAPGIEVEFELAKEFLKDMKIEEVNQMVSQLITAENVIFEVSLPESSIDKPTQADILAIFKKAENTKYDEYVDDLGDAKLMTVLPKAGKITSTKKLPFDITEIKLSNGARVLLKPTDFKNDQILFNCWADGGVSLYSEKENFIAMNADVIMRECGLGEFNSNNLNKLLQSKFVILFPSISHYSQNMGGSTPPKNMETFFQLLHLRFTKPRKDAEAFASYVARQRESIINSERDPQSAYRDSIGAILGNYHPRSMPLTVAELEKFELDRAYSIYKERFSDASNFTFLFVGAFTLDEIKPFIEQYIASLPATNKNEKWKDLNIKSPTGQVNKIIRKGIEHKATVNIFMDTYGVNFTSDELLKMNAMREVANILLREEIREEKGGTYGIRISANMVHIPQPRVRINISFGCEPERVDELVSAIKEVLDGMQKEISSEYLRNIKQIMKNEFATRTKENNYWLATINSYDYTKRDLAFLQDYDKKIDALTEADIITAAKKYLNHKTNFISIIQMPEQP